MRAWIFLLATGCGRLGFDVDVADSGIDVAIDAAPPPCPPLPGLLFCESFEGAALLPTIAGDVAVDDTRAFRGQRAQRATSVGANLPSWQLGGVLPNLTSGDLYVRWHIYLPSSVSGIEFASVHVVEASLPFSGILFNTVNGIPQVSATAGSVTAFSSMTMPIARWVCLQMHVVISNTDGSIDGAVDGQPFGPVSAVDTLPAGGYRNVHVGLYPTADDPMMMWSDEVAVGTLPIPCD